MFKASYLINNSQWMWILWCTSNDAVMWTSDGTTQWQLAAYQGHRKVQEIGGVNSGGSLVVLQHV